MIISFFCFTVQLIVIPNGLQNKNIFSNKTLNWHGFSNIFIVIPAIRLLVSTGSGGCYFFASP